MRIFIGSKGAFTDSQTLIRFYVKFRMFWGVILSTSSVCEGSVGSFPYKSASVAFGLLVNNCPVIQIASLAVNGINTEPVCSAMSKGSKAAVSWLVVGLQSTGFMT